MTIKTKSLFYYGFDVDENNYALDFSEGSGEIQADVNIDDYTLTEFITEIKRVLLENGSLEYDVVVDRDTRKVTISAPTNFELLVASGSRNGTSIFSLLGFVGDKTGANSYLSDNPAGSEWRPQDVAWGYVPKNKATELIDSVVNESTSGVLETISFGVRERFKMEFRNISNLEQRTGVTKRDNNPIAEEEAEAFMDFATKRKRVEFMPDRDTTSVFYKLELEKTPQSQNGTSYELSKMYGETAPNYYSTGSLVFREVD